MLQTRQLWVRAIEWLILNFERCVIRQTRLCCILLIYDVVFVISNGYVYKCQTIDSQFHTNNYSSTGYGYLLVQVKRRKLSSTRMPLGLINSNVIFLVSYWPLWTVEEGDNASFYVRDLGLALLILVNVSPPTTGFQKGQQRSGVFVVEHASPYFFWASRMQVR